MTSCRRKNRERESRLAAMANSMDEGCLELEHAPNELLRVDLIVGAVLAFMTVVFLLSVLGLIYLLCGSRLAEGQFAKALPPVVYVLTILLPMLITRDNLRGRWWDIAQLHAPACEPSGRQHKTCAVCMRGRKGVTSECVFVFAVFAAVLVVILVAATILADVLHCWPALRAWTPSLSSAPASASGDDIEAPPRSHARGRLSE